MAALQICKETLIQLIAYYRRILKFYVVRDILEVYKCCYKVFFLWNVK
jgi:hypothetical protein